MPKYKYKLRNKNNRFVTGEMEGENEQEVAALIKARDEGVLIQIEKVNLAFSFGRLKGIKLFDRVKAGELSLFCRQFATLINSGVPILQSINILHDQTQHQIFKKSLQKVRYSLEDGKSLSVAFREAGKVFPDILRNMVEAGEKAGILDEVFERLAVYYEREADIKEKVRSATTYPLVILIVAIIAINIMLIFILPTFVGMLADSGAAMPLPTQILLDISNFMRGFWWLLLGILAGGVSFFKRALKRDSFRYRFDGYLLRLPVFGPVIQKIIISRFARTLSSMIKAGVPMLDALETTKQTLGNRKMAKVLQEAQNNVLEGKGISEPLQASSSFPVLVSQMIAVGEETGALDNLLEKVASFYDREVDNVVKQLSTLIEPLLIVGLGVVLGMIIIAMMLPMIEVMSATPV